MGRLACLFEGAAHEPQIAGGFGFWFARARLCGFFRFKFFRHGADNSSRHGTRRLSYFGVMVRHSRVESLVEVREVYERLRASVCRAVVGKDSVVDLCLVSLLPAGTCS